MGLLARLWKIFTGGERKSFQKEFNKLTPEARFMYHALRGTSVEDRQWMMGLR
jgi:hypothetical protein